MKKEILYEPFDIAYRKIDESIEKEHIKTYFELVFVLSGTGKQWINQSQFDYHTNHMFLLTPDDVHAFDVTTTSEFFFLRFNDIYIRSNTFQPADITRLEYILKNATRQPGCILRNISDKPMVRVMIEAMISEMVNRDLYNRELIEKMVQTIIVVVARNIAKFLPTQVTECSDEKLIGLMNYIQENIFYPEKLKAEKMVADFGISENYLGKYFKAHTGQTLQQYISNLKIKHIQSRLKHSELRINEISYELGFTDESHFNKFYKRHTGKTATEWRKILKYC